MNIGFATGFDLADRQSRPSISSDIWARLIVTTPSVGLGQMNFPSVRRFCIRRKPLPSYIKTLIVWAARPRKMKRWQHEGIFAQHRLDLRGQAVDTAAQVGATRRQVNTHPIRQPDHERLSMTVSSRSK